MLSLLEKLTEIYLLSNQTLYMEVGMAKFKPIVLPFIYFSLFLAAKILQFFFLYAYFFKGNFGLPNFCQFFLFNYSRCSQIFAISFANTSFLSFFLQPNFQPILFCFAKFMISNFLLIFQPTSPLPQRNVNLRNRKFHYMQKAEIGRCFSSNEKSTCINGKPAKN